MTVRELMQALRRCDPEAEVETEGCDCIGDVAEIRQSQEPKKILLMRGSNGVVRYGTEDWP